MVKRLIVEKIPSDLCIFTNKFGLVDSWKVAFMFSNYKPLNIKPIET